MKRHSIQFKFLVTIISAMMAITLVIGGLSVFEVDNFVKQQMESFIGVNCEKEASQLNDIFGDMEKSVNIMSGYILSLVDNPAEIEIRDRQKKIIQNTEKMFSNVEKDTVGAVAYYLRIAPELSDGVTGFFYSKKPSGGEYFAHEITDLSLYDKDDTGHVGWFWQPYEAGEPVWMQPYYNKNNDIMMISYVVPLYCEGRFFGVVGMDFDYTVLTEKVHDIKIYENGCAHLMVNGMFVCHDESVPSFYAAEDYLQVSEALRNGMTLVLSASYEDLAHIRYDIAIRILYTVLVLAAVFCLITILMVRRIVEPLEMLTDASKKLAAGDYSVEHVNSDTYEIHLLSTAFENMAMHLREHENVQHLMARRDSMTGLRNTTSYKSWTDDFNHAIQNKAVDFGIVVLDVNGLKQTNDQYGHDVGDKLIIAAAKLISDTFKRSPVFRIGGDEFLVILQNRDLEDYEELCNKMDLESALEYVEAGEARVPISVARGFAKYDPEMDFHYVDVFNRADEAMYRNKREMKLREESRSFL